MKIEQNGKILAELPVDYNTEFQVISDGTTTNTVVIEDGKVFVKTANCRDQVCVNHKKISRKGESIICLPNKVVISLESPENDEVDGVAE